MKQPLYNLFGGLMMTMVLLGFSSRAEAQSLQFNAVHTLQYSLSGHGSTSSTYTVPSGKVA
jgi:hypothetical protein